MKQDDSQSHTAKLTCEQVRDLLYLYSCDELEAEEREEVTVHLATCEGCTAALAEHESLKQSLPTGFVNRKLFYYSCDN